MRIDYDEYSAKYFTTQPSRWNINSEVTLNWGVQKTDNVDFWKSQPDYNGYDLFTDIINSRMPEIRNYWTEEDEDGKIHRKKVKSILKEPHRLDSLRKIWSRSLRIGFIRTMNERKIW